jgi:hypothetical protein
MKSIEYPSQQTTDGSDRGHHVHTPIVLCCWSIFCRSLSGNAAIIDRRPGLPAFLGWWMSAGLRCTSIPQNSLTRHEGKCIDSPGDVWGMESVQFVRPLKDVERDKGAGNAQTDRSSFPSILEALHSQVHKQSPPLFELHPYSGLGGYALYCP